MATGWGRETRGPLTAITRVPHADLLDGFGGAFEGERPVRLHRRLRRLLTKDAFHRADPVSHGRQASKTHDRGVIDR